MPGILTQDSDSHVCVLCPQNVGMAFQFKLNEALRPRRHYPSGWVSRVKWVKPEPLYVLSSYACNDLPEMSYFKWNGRKVQQWIAKIGFPQYKVGVWWL